VLLTWVDVWLQLMQRLCPAALTHNLADRQLLLILVFSSTQNQLTQTWTITET